MTSVDFDRFAGIERLYGAGSLARLAASHGVVVGLGGVGSWAAEALARSGVGRLTLIDGDEVCISNSNRQLPALVGSYGQAKTAVLAERLQAINPSLVLEPQMAFVSASDPGLLLPDAGAVVLDAIDNARTKAALIAFCRRRKQSVISVGAAGGRIDPTRIRRLDLSRTCHDALLADVRLRLRKQHFFPTNLKRRFGVPAIYSEEQPRWPQADGSVCAKPPEGLRSGLDCGGGLGAATHVTAAFAMAAVAAVLERMLAK